MVVMIITENLRNRLNTEKHGYTIMLSESQYIDTALFGELSQKIEIVRPVRVITAHIDQHTQRFRHGFPSCPCIE
ncbi:MAG: hypothetical protein Q9M23_08110 [Mariprofundaceae bacterium]|nr:hypothetical protein [Mariprofundaceae bacterium]